MKFFRPNVLAIIFIILILGLDFLIPPGTAVASFYLIPLSFIIHERRSTIIWFSVVCIFLTILDTIIGYHPTYRDFIESPLTAHEGIIMQRFFIIIGIGLFTLITVKYNKMKELRDHKQQILTNSLKEMMFLTSHKVRKPIAQIIGLSNFLNSRKLTQDELIKIVGWMKKSISSLNMFTIELTNYMNTLEEKEGKIMDEKPKAGK